MIAEGAILFREGDVGDAFYLVVRGSVGIYASAGDELGERRLNALGPGAPFGEMALLTDHPRSATVRAETEAEVLRLERGRFLSPVRREPQVGLGIAATLSERRRRSDARHAASGREVEAAAPAAPSETSAPPAARRRERGGPSAQAIGRVVSGAILLLTWLTAAPAGLMPAGWRALGTLVAAVPILAVDGIPEGVLALTLAAVWVLGGIASAPVALSGFTSISWVLLVSVLTIGAAVASSGLLYQPRSGQIRGRGHSPDAPGALCQRAGMAGDGTALRKRRVTREVNKGRKDVRRAP